MALTPAKTDPNREKELERRKRDPLSFGVGKPLTDEQQKRQQDSGKK